MKVSIRHSAEMASLFQHAGLKPEEIGRYFTQYSKATIYRHCKKPIGEEPPIDHEN